jgi:8-oxo-dGTP pyrophosphatase MutT (NUDIX family)
VLVVTRSFKCSVPSTCASAVCLKGDDGKWLVARRAWDDEGGGRIGLVAGRAEKGETPLEAVIRETLEELGVEVTPDIELGIVDVPGAHLHLWLCHTDKDAALNPDPTEIDEILWLTIEELAKHPDALEGLLGAVAILENQ